MCRPDAQKRAQFVDNYVESGNATDAARRAGVPARSAHTMGSRWLKSPEIAAQIRERVEAGLDDLAPAAVATIGELMLDPAAPPSTRLAAARDILDRLGWIPPKRAERPGEAREKDLAEMSLAELHELAAGQKGVRLDDEALAVIAGELDAEQ